MSCVRFRHGSWGADYRDGFGRRRWRRFSSERAAAAFLHERETSSAPATVADYAALYLDELRSRVSETTRERYRKEYESNIGRELGGRLLADVTRFELKRLVAAAIATGKRPGMLLKVLSQLFGAALDDGLIETNPAARLSRLFRNVGENRSEVKALTKPELLRFFVEAEDSEPLYAPLFRTMLLAGLRLGEGRALQAGDVHRSERRLDVVRTFSGDRLGTTTKTRSARRIEIPAELAELLAERAERTREAVAWLFSRRGAFLRERACLVGFQRIVRRAELPRHLSPHSLRHTYASTLIQQGVPIAYVQRQLGHSSIRQTVDVYGRWLPLSQASALERFARDVAGGDGDGPVTGGDDDGGARCRVLSFSRRSERRASIRRRPGRSPNDVGSPQNLTPSPFDEEPA